MMNCVKYFPNATELTLLDSFNDSIDQITNTLNRIVPLIQLTRLCIDCEKFSFENLINLMRFTPNLHSLTVNSTTFPTTYSTSIEESETFQLVSNTNIIKTFTFPYSYSLERVKLIVKLCPQLQHLNLDYVWKELESILEYLLSKTDDSPRNLSSLRGVFFSTLSAATLLNLIKSRKWLKNCSVELIGEEMFLWW
jgi:hypothetical protein